MKLTLTSTLIASALTLAAFSNAAQAGPSGGVLQRH